MAQLSRLRRLVRTLCIVYGVIGAVAVVLMMALVTTDVFSRAVSKPVLGVYELVEFSMVVAVCSAFGVAQVNRYHIRIDVLTSLMPARARAALDSVTGLVMLAFIVAVGWMGYTQTVTARDSDLISALLRIPRWPFELWLAVGWSLFFLGVFADFLLSLGRALGKADEPPPTPRVEESLF